jgi:hypothetical protein
MPGMVLGDVAVWHWLYLIAKPPHVGVDVDRLACPLHRPTVCDHQTRGQSLQSGAALSHHATVGGGAFPGGVKSLGLDIQWSVDRLGTCVIESYMEKTIFTRARLCMSELSWRLCVYPWLSYFVRW